MPRTTRHSPDDPVPRDSNSTLWKCLQEGLIDEHTDVTASGHIDPNISENLPAPSPTNWAASMQATTPFGRQTRPNVFSTPERKPSSASGSPPPPPPAPNRERKKQVLGDVANQVTTRVLQLEIQNMEMNEEKHRVALGMLDRIISISKELHTPASANKEN